MGFIINFIPCIVLGYYRGKLTYDSASGPVSSDLTNMVQICYYSCLTLLLFSALVLADALRRIMRTLKDNPFLQANEKIMWLHIIMLVTHVFIFCISDYFIFRAFNDPTNITYQFE